MNSSWVHRELPLKIGKNTYTFRTLSLYDVWALWPHLAPMAEAIAGEKPISYAQHIVACLRVVCPPLVENKDDFQHWEPIHINALFEFYAAQDWPKIQSLGEATTTDGAAAKYETDDGLTADQRFLVICAAGANFTKMSLLDFVQARFEFAADVILAMNAVRKEKDESMTTDQFALLLKNIMPTQRVTDETKPAWMKKIETEN